MDPMLYTRPGRRYDSAEADPRIAEARKQLQHLKASAVTAEKARIYGAAKALRNLEELYTVGSMDVGEDLYAWLPDVRMDDHGGFWISSDAKTSVSPFEFLSVRVTRTADSLILSGIEQARHPLQRITAAEAAKHAHELWMPAVRATPPGYISAPVILH